MGAEPFPMAVRLSLTRNGLAGPKRASRRLPPRKTGAHVANGLRVVGGKLPGLRIRYSKPPEALVDGRGALSYGCAFESDQKWAGLVLRGPHGGYLPGKQAPTSQTACES